MKIDKIPSFDPYVYRMIANGQTEATFQIESVGMQQLMRQMFDDVNAKIIVLETEYGYRGYPSPITSVTKIAETGKSEEEFVEKMTEFGRECFARLVAGISLYRPGPMDFIPQYIEGLHNRDSIHYDVAELEPILGETYGVFVYQEQVMQAIRSLAGYTLGRADIVRRAMGKKKKKVMAAEREVFLYGNEENHKIGETIVPGCIKNGIPEDIAIVIWDKMAAFAEYAFNKSHATGYADVCIKTAWEKNYRTVPYMCATLNSVINNRDKLLPYISMVKNMGIQIEPASIDNSSELFKVQDKKIITGLESLKFVGKEAKNIVANRDANGYASFSDFLVKTNIGKSAIVALAKIGAFDKFGYTKRSIIEQIDKIVDQKKKIIEVIKVDDEISSPLLIEMYLKKANITIDEMPEYSKNEMLEFEKEVAGVYTSGHPFELFSKFIPDRTYLSKMQSNTIGVASEDDGFETETAEALASNGKYTVGGMINEVKVINTKKGDTMCFVEIEDETSTQSVVVFPEKYKLFKDLFVEGKPIAFYGNADINNDRVSFIADEVIEVTDDMESVEKKIVLDVKDGFDTSIFSKPGSTWIYLRYPDGHITRSTTPRSITLKDLKGVI